MAFKKRQQSKIVDKANKRNDGIKSIGPEIDLGNGLTVTAFTAEIAKVESQRQAYNTLLSDVDGALSKLNEAEKALGDFSKRMLNGVGSKYGYDSIEYEKAGGIRKSERKRPVKTTPAPAK
jgi:hypothetical protein